MCVVVKLGRLKCYLLVMHDNCNNNNYSLVGFLNADDRLKLCGLGVMQILAVTLICWVDW
jgi:hypothetical protein